MLPLGIIFISSALICYTIAVFTERKRKKLQLWMILLFASGFACDFIGTGTMFLVAEEKFSFSFHSLAGYSALIIMFIHLLWAISAFRKPIRAKLFNKYSIYAWCIWLVAFISGTPKG